MSRIRISGNGGDVPWQIGRRCQVAQKDYIVTHICRAGSQWHVDLCETEEYLLQQAVSPFAVEQKFADGTRLVPEAGDTVADFLTQVRKAVLSRIA